MIHLVFVLGFIAFIFIIEVRLKAEIMRIERDINEIKHKLK